MYDKSASLTLAERTALLTKLQALGYSAAVLSSVVVAGATRQQIADRLTALQRQAPKG